MTNRKASQETVRLISLGGMAEIGKNLTLLEQEGSIMAIDCGLTFPSEEQPGVDVILPDMTYMIDNADSLAGVFLTHGHEDHLGALPYLLEVMPVRIYGTKLSLGLLEAKLQEFRPLPGYELIPVAPGDEVEVGPFTVEVIRVNHSIPDAVGLAVRTAAGTVLFSGDFKFDYTPIGGEGADFRRLAQIGGEGVLCLLSDCTNVERPGHSPSERVVGENLRALFRDAPGRIIVTTFASNISRTQQVINEAVATDRVVAITGRSMERMVGTAERLGYLHIPEGTMVPIDHIDDYEPRQVVIVTTGSQGEPLSALARMSRRSHKHVKIAAGDTVIMSATPIPGNESLIWRTINRLFGLGARVIYGSEQGVHASGHAYQDELRLMLSLTRPTFVIPIHGDRRHQVLYSDLAMEMGVPERNIFRLEAGASVDLRPDRAYRGPNVPAGAVNVDGLGVGDVGEVVLNDRLILSQEGIFLPIIVIAPDTCELLATPDIYSRGFVHMDEAQDLLDSVREHLRGVVEEFADGGNRNLEELYSTVKSATSRFLMNLTARRPLVLPVIVPVGGEEAVHGELGEAGEDQLDYEDDD